MIRYVTLALFFIASTAAGAPLRGYLVASMATSEADGLRGAAGGVLVRSIAKVAGVDLVADVSLLRTSKIDAGDGTTRSAAFEVRVPYGPWYASTGASWSRLETSSYRKSAWAPRIELGRGIQPGLWVSGHWRLPDDTENRAEAFGLALHWRTGRIYQRWTVEQLRHSTDEGVRLGYAIGWAWGCAPWLSGKR